MSDQKHHSLFDSLKSMVVEDDPSAPTPVPVAPAPVAAAAVSPFSLGSSAAGTAPAFAPAAYTPPPAGASTLSSFVGGAAPVSSAEAEDFYQKLFTKTNFDTTDIANTINKFLGPLKALPMDDNLKFRTAVAQAKANANITEDAILNTFDTLKTTLATAADNFKTKVGAFEDKEITARQNRLADIAQQLTALQTEQTQVTSDLAAAQAKDAGTQTAFNTALTKRGTEIDGQKAQFASMLTK